MPLFPLAEGKVTVDYEFFKPFMFIKIYILLYEHIYLLPLFKIFTKVRP